MTDRQNFERLRGVVKNLLTEYEEHEDKYTDTLDRLENAQFLYENLVLILNDSEGWEAEE